MRPSRGRCGEHGEISRGTARGVSECARCRAYNRAAEPPQTVSPSPELKNPAAARCVVVALGGRSRWQRELQVAVWLPLPSPLPPDSARHASACCQRRGEEIVCVPTKVIQPPSRPERRLELICPEGYS